MSGNSIVFGGDERVVNFQQTASGYGPDLNRVSLSRILWTTSHRMKSLGIQYNRTNDRDTIRFRYFIYSIMTQLLDVTLTFDQLKLDISAYLLENSAF